MGKELASTAAASVGVRHSLTAVIVTSAITSSNSGSVDGLLVLLLGPAVGESGAARASAIKCETLPMMQLLAKCEKKDPYLSNISPKDLVSLLGL